MTPEGHPPTEAAQRLAGSKGPYLDIDMPDRFVLEVLTDRGSWIEEAECYAHLFERMEDGAYVCGGVHSPIWLRCIEHGDDHFVHVDGGGEYFRYRLVPVLG